MKKKSRMIALVLVLALSVAMLPQMALTAHAAIHSGTCGAEGDNLTWTLDTELGVLTIEGSGKMENFSMHTPWYDDRGTIKTLILPDGLTSISASAFSFCNKLKDVTIPDTVTDIGRYAFERSGLSEVSIPAAVTEIGEGAFDCPSLTAIHVASDSPAYCSLDGVLFNKARTELIAYPSQKTCSVYEIPEGVVTVHGSQVYCNYLTAIIVPSSVESLGDEPFLNCNSLAEIQVASENEHYSSLDGVLFNKDRTELIQYPKAKTDASYTVPNGVQCIKGEAFAYCEHLQNVVIPNSVTVIEFWAFLRCKALTGITLPDSIERIDINAFKETAYFEDENNWDGRLLYLGHWLLAARSEILTADIREGTVGIAAGAFRNCVSMRSVSIPGSVKMIGEDTFLGCASLANVAMSNDVTEIGAAAFSGCTSLKSLTLPDSLTFIGEAAFARSALQSITIPGSVTEIDCYAFDECEALEEVTISDGVTRIDEWAFVCCSKLASVEIPASVTEIGDGAFGYRFDDDGYLIEGFIIYGDKGTAAENYAKDNYNCAFVLRPTNNHFADVKESDFFFTPVLWALGNDVTGGVDDTHFAPEQTVMRADSMVFFWAAKGRPKFTATDKTFKDVKKTHWAYDAVMWAVEKGITGGTNTEGTKFSPKRTCSRSEVLQFLYAAMGKPEYTIDNPYSDVKGKHWYYEGAIWAYENGLEKGEDGKFNAKTPCTRGYVVTYLYRYFTGNELAQ